MGIEESIRNLSNEELIALEKFIFDSVRNEVGPDYVLEKQLPVSAIEKLDLAVSAKGHFFKRTNKSIFHEKVEEIYSVRASVKKGMKKKEQRIEDIKVELKNRGVTV